MVGKLIFKNTHVAKNKFLPIISIFHRIFYDIKQIIEINKVLQLENLNNTK